MRREAVDNAITNLRLEGLFASPRVGTVLERFVQGEINSEEDLVRSVLAR